MTSGFGLTGVDFLTDAFGSNNVGIASNKEKKSYGRGEQNVSNYLNLLA